MGDHQGWYEILPAGPVPQQVYGHPGWRFIAETNRAVGGFAFYLYDSYSGNSTTFSVSSNSYDGYTADFVVERPQGGGQTLTNFYYLDFLDAWVNGTGSSHALGNYGYYAVQMWQGSDELAYPDGLTNGGQTFRDHYHQCI